MNAAKFLQNGNCGYVLRPEYMFRGSYFPLDPGTIQGEVQPVAITIRVMAARHLARYTNFKHSIDFKKPFAISEPQQEVHPRHGLPLR